MKSSQGDGRNALHYKFVNLCGNGTSTVARVRVLLLMFVYSRVSLMLVF